MIPIFQDILHEFTDDDIIKYIMLAVMIDVILGISKAIMFHKLNSKTSINGLFRQILIVCLPPMIHPIIMSITGGSVFYAGFTMLILLSVMLSIVENYAEMGLPYPEVLKKFIDDSKTNVDIGTGTLTGKTADNSQQSQSSTPDSTTDNKSTSTPVSSNTGTQSSTIIQDNPENSDIQPIESKDDNVKAGDVNVDTKGSGSGVTDNNSSNAS